MKLCKSCNTYYENIDPEQKFCVTCGNLLEDVHICPKCHEVNPIDFDFCCKCGSKLTVESNAIIVRPSTEPISSVNITETQDIESIPYVETVKPKKSFHITNEQKKIIGGLVAFAIIIGCGYFYFAGPSQHHVESLKNDANITGLIDIINNRSESEMFDDVTESAVKAIIDLSSGNYSDGVKRVGNYLLAGKTNIKQKRAIVKAFTDNKMVVPHFYDVYKNGRNKDIRHELQENGLSVDSEIFKKKLIATFNEIIESSRSSFKDYK